jgi:hypothetical protein
MLDERTLEVAGSFANGDIDRLRVSMILESPGKKNHFDLGEQPKKQRPLG